MLFLRPYTLKRAVIKNKDTKNVGDAEKGLGADNGTKMADADQTQLGVAPAPGLHEKGTEEVEPRRSTAKSRTSEADGDAGTIAGEPEMTKQ